MVWGIAVKALKYGSTKKNKRIRSRPLGMPRGWGVCYIENQSRMKIIRIRVQSSGGPYSVVAGAGVISRAAQEITGLGHFSSVHVVSSPKVWRAVGKIVHRGLRLS